MIRNDWYSTLRHSVYWLWRELVYILFPPTHGGAWWQDITATEVASLYRLQTIERELSVLTCYPYQNELIKELLWTTKFRRVPKALLPLLENLRSADLQQFRGATLVPIPLSKTRLRERGFNQSELIARHLQTLIPDSQVAPILTRPKATEHQSRLSRKQRFQNTKGAFMVTDPTAVANQRILIIDDIVTTGATLGEARHTLLQAGAHAVKALVLAH